MRGLFRRLLSWLPWRRENPTPTAEARRAFEQREAERRTSVTPRDIQGWVTALHVVDPSFDLAAFLDRTRMLFLQTREAWCRRDLEPVRRFMSDATFKRLEVQLRLLKTRGVPDAIADLEVLDLQMIGLDQSKWFDTVNVRIRTRIRDARTPWNDADEETLAAATPGFREASLEVWSFFRRSGAKTRLGQDLSLGKCPNCGAPFAGGASNACGYCRAVVNSGNHGWVLAEITQGVEAIPGYATVDGLLQAREADPALNLQVLEDRAALVFWKWIEAQSLGEPERMAKVATPGYRKLLGQELELQGTDSPKVFLECVVGAVDLRLLRIEEDREDAHVEIRWSARMGFGPVVDETARPAVAPQRWMFVLTRAASATTSTANGLSTSRCPRCAAPLTDTSSPSCDYCGANLDAGDGDWVLRAADPYARWNENEARRFSRVQERETRDSRRRASEKVAAAISISPPEIGPLDASERERLVYMMAGIAAADGMIDGREEKLLRLCAERWSIPWADVEIALESSGQMFDQLIPRGGPEAEELLAAMVQLARIDRSADRTERRMLELAARHLGIPERLGPLLERKR